MPPVLRLLSLLEIDCVLEGLETAVDVGVDSGVGVGVGVFVVLPVIAGVVDDTSTPPVRT
jgi:hypothetical protein